jgi:uncharacterized protein (DUF302 family)
LRLSGYTFNYSRPSRNKGDPDSNRHRLDFKTLLGRLEEAVTKNDMLIIAKASASDGAEKRGIKIRGDAVIFVFRNDFAVRMLEASTEAGLEAPIPIHVFEAADGSTHIAYRSPSAVFRLYRAKALEQMAREMDPIFERIVAQAATK